MTWLAVGVWAAIGALGAIPAAVFFEQWRERTLWRRLAKWGAALMLLGPLGFEIAIGVPPLIAATAIVPAVVFFVVRGIVSSSRRS